MANLESINRRVAGVALAASLIAAGCGADIKPSASPTQMPSGSPSGSLDIQATPKPTEAAGSPTPDASASVAPSASTEALTGLEVGQLARPIPVPEAISGSMARELRLLDGEKIPMYSEREWFNPVYDPTQEGKDHDYRGIGPWYPVAFENVDSGAAVLTTHGNVGEIVVSGRKGGDVMVAFMQLDKHQKDGAWGTDPKTGRFMQNSTWEMQYNFHSLAPLQEIWIVDPDTGKNLTWPDGSPVIYRANEQGIAAFAIPETKGKDVRVGFVFNMPAQGDGVQPPEVKIERGPNDNPSKKGENPLPDSVLKPMIPEK